MTFGDYIRSKNDKELAEILINTITANSDLFEEYRIDLGGYYSFNVVNENDLEKILKQEIVE
jgi:hypothetical protein